MRQPFAVAALVVSLVVSASGQFRTHNDRFPPPAPMSAEQWARRAAWLREHVLASAGLLPLPERTPLNAVVFDEVKQAGYRVSKVYFESLPGFFVTGNLYRPDGDGPFPAVLSAHGHWTYGRLENTPVMSGPGRAIGLARQGFVVFTYDMVGYDDSRQLPHTFGGKRETLWGLSLAGLQLWNGMRSLDFLESLPFVRRGAIGMTGESGGGSQTFLLAAADARVAAAVPVNMISLHMQGGCLCENPPGLRIDTTNVEIAATVAPRPMLMVSATGDWTAETLEVEFPAVRSLYALAGAADHVAAVRFDAPHNYNKDSREAMYAWMARWLQGAPADSRRPEAAFSPASLQELLVFHGRPLPASAVNGSQLTSAWIDAARRQLTTGAAAVRATALRHALTMAEGSGGERPKTVATRVVLTAGVPAETATVLRSAGFSVRPIAFSPYDVEAASKIEHFETYNRTLASQRVAEIVAALRSAPGAAIVATGDEALAAVLASAVERPSVAVLDVGGFDTSRDEDYLARLYIPGVRRAGDIRTASEVAGDRLVIHGAGATFEAPGARVSRERLRTSEIVAEIRRAFAR